MMQLVERLLCMWNNYQQANQTSNGVSYCLFVCLLILFIVYRQAREYLPQTEASSL